VAQAPDDQARSAVAAAAEAGGGGYSVGSAVFGTGSPALTDEEIRRVQLLVPDASVERIRSVRDRLDALDQQWASAGLGASLTLSFPV
jgi:hypothetical protein